jgi:hypothetical protein
MIPKNFDLRFAETDVRLTQAERMEAQMRHLAASNQARLRHERGELKRRGIGLRVAISSAFVPANVARAFTHVKVA